MHKILDSFICISWHESIFKTFLLFYKHMIFKGFIFAFVLINSSEAASLLGPGPVKGLLSTKLSTALVDKPKNAYKTARYSIVQGS